MTTERATFDGAPYIKHRFFSYGEAGEYSNRAEAYRAACTYTNGIQDGWRLAGLHYDDCTGSEMGEWLAIRAAA